MGHRFTIAHFPSCQVGGCELAVLAELTLELLLGCTVIQLGCLGFLPHDLPTLSRRAQADSHPRGKGSKRTNRILQPSETGTMLHLRSAGQRKSQGLLRYKQGAKRCHHLTQGATGSHCRGWTQGVDAGRSGYRGTGGGHRERVTGVVFVFFYTRLPYMLSLYQYVIRRTKLPFNSSETNFYFG